MIAECCCPVVRHQHGTSTMYVVDRCRCDECRAARAAAERRRSRQRAIVAFNPDLAPFVDGSIVRRHMRQLMAQGMGWKRIGKAAGVANGTVYVILYGKGGNNPAEHRPPRKRVSREVAEKILAVRLDLADGARTDATGTTRRLRALVAIGWPQSQLAKRLGILPSNATPLFDGSRTLVRACTVRDVAALYEELWDQPGPSKRALNDAARKGWAPPLAWDDDTIDDPNAAADLEPRPTRRSRADLVEDWHDTWDHHLGDLDIAATRLGVTVHALRAALLQVDRQGIEVRRAS